MPDPILKKIVAALRAGRSKDEVRQALEADGLAPDQVARLLDDATTDLGDVGRSLAQGLTFGFADEIGGALSAATGGDYRTRRDEIRRRGKAYKEAHPVLAGGLELAGGLAPALISPTMLAVRGVQAARAAAPAATGLAKALQVGKGLVGAGIVGGAAGAAQAAGESEQTGSALVGDITRGAGVGLATGAALPALLGGGAAATRWAGRRLMPGRWAAGEAERRLGGALGDEAAERLARAEEIRPGQAMVADLTPEAQDLLDNAVTQSPRVAARAGQELEERAAGQSSRLQRDVEQIAAGDAGPLADDFRIDATAAGKALEGELEDLGKRLYAPLHKAFPRIRPNEPIRGASGRFIPAEPAKAIQDFMERPIVRAAYGVTNARELMVNPKAGAPSLQQVQGVIRRLRAANKRLGDMGDPEARLFKQAADELEGLTEQAIPGFAAANRQYAAVAINRDAIAGGAKALMQDPRVVADELEGLIARATAAGGPEAGERVAQTYRYAIVDDLLTKLRGKGFRRNEVRNWFGYFTNPDENQRALLRFAFGDDPKLLRMVERGELEKIFEITARAGKNSATARRLAGQQAMEEGTEGLITDMAAGSVLGGVQGAAAAGLGTAARAIRGQSQRMAPRVAEALEEPLLARGDAARQVIQRLTGLHKRLEKRLEMQRRIRQGAGYTVPRLFADGQEQPEGVLSFQ